MTWSVWNVAPFITSIFFILGVFTLYTVLFNWGTTALTQRKISFDETKFNAYFGILYVLAFVFSLQVSVVGTPISWQFMNFQIIAMIFCAYFLNIKLPYKFLVPIILVYMIFNHSILYWQSWCHAITLMTTYSLFNHLRRDVKSKYSFRLYSLIGIFFGALMWFFVSLKYSLPFSTFAQELIYLVIFELLLFSYVVMILRDSDLKSHLIELANHDALTKTQNYAAYSSEIDMLFNDSKTNNLNLSMMMFDIDHFKEINDTYGHLVGDKVLQHVASVTQEIIDRNDSHIKLYRTGGEEFNVLFPGYDLNATKPVVDEIFEALNHLDVPIDQKNISISISIGVSQISQKDADSNAFYARVDDNLYHSKRNGRMQITAV